MDAKWDDGNFLGYHRSSNTYFISTKDGLKMVRLFQRKPMVNRWSPDELSKPEATPWSEREKPDAGIKFREAIPNDKQVIDNAPQTPDQ